MQETASPGKIVWNIFLDKPSPPYRRSAEGYSTGVNAITGEILHFHFHYPIPSTKGLKEVKEIISKEKAFQIAEELARKLNPEKFTQMKLDPESDFSPLNYPNYLDTGYNFSWSRLHNGVTVNGDSLHVTVDALTGQVTNYFFNWREQAKFPPFKSLLKAEEIAQQVIEKAGMVLVYTAYPPKHPLSSPEAKLVYQVNAPYIGNIDASNRKFLDYEGKPVLLGKIYENYAHLKGEMKPPSSLHQKVSMAKAKEEAEKFFNLLGIKGKIEQSGGGGRGGPFNDEWWSFALRQEGRYETIKLIINVGIDKATGQVVDFHHYPFMIPPDAETKPISQEEALRSAKDFIAKVNPDYATQVVLGKGMPEKLRPKPLKILDRYSFKFFRVVNGIPLKI